MIKHSDPKAKPGLRIHLISMDSEDPNPIDSGLEGTIDRIDDLGTIHVNWDDGRILGVIPGVDEYNILPPTEEQIKPDEFMGMFRESSDVKISTAAKKLAQTSKPVKNVKLNLKRALSPSGIKVESEKIKGGKAENMTPKDLSKKHKVDIKDIEKEIEVGTKIEMEHTDSKKIAKEIAMDHIAEFSDYYTNKKHGVKASEKGLEKDLEETATASSAGAYSPALFGGETTVEKPKAKKLATKIITKGDLKNPLGKIYSFGAKTESKIFKVGDLLSEIASTHAAKLRAAEGTYDGDPWVGKKGWMRKDELTWPGGEISDILTKMDINWNDSDLSLTDKQTDKINEEESISKEPKIGDYIPTTMGRLAFWIDHQKPRTVVKYKGHHPNISMITRDLKITGKEKTKYGTYWILNNGEYKISVNKLKDGVVETDKINEGWLFKTKEDKMVLNILKRVKQNFPTDITIGDARYQSAPTEGEEIRFSLPGIKQNARIRVTYGYSPYDGKYAVITVNNTRLKASEWAIKKIYKYLYDILEERHDKKSLNQIQADLTDPNFAQDVFDILGDEDVVNEGKKKKTKESPIHKKKWERCVKDVKKQNKKDGKDYNPYAVCTASIGYEGSIKKPHRKKDKEELEETTTFSSVFGGGFPVTPFMFAKKGKHIPSKKPIWKGGKIVQKANKADLLGEHTEVKDSPIPGVTSAQFRDELMSIWGLENVEFIKKGVYSTDSKEEYILNNEGFINTPKKDRPKISSLYGKTIMTWTQDMGYSIQELNKVKWVKGGKYVKIKDKCAKYNNQPWCSQGAIDNPLEFSDTVFENIKSISKKTGIKESEILDKIKAKLNGVSKEKMEYNKKHGLPIWWQGSKEGFYEKMEPRKNNNGSN